PAATTAPAPFEIKEGDRVLLLGDALLERENTYGYLETRMHEQFPDRKFTVRNLSMSGDTPRGWSRASFDPPEKGFERLKEQIALVKPTVVFLGYGMAASLQEMSDRSGDIMLNPDPARYGSEPMTAARFKKELGQLMDAIVEISGGKGTAAGAAVQNGLVRFVLLSPIKHEDLRATRPGLPDPAEHNKLLEQYSKVIEELAKERGARFVRLDDLRQDARSGETLTLNGIHPSAKGGAAINGYLADRLGWKAAPPPDLDAKFPKLRDQIAAKNALFFHRTRPSNTTYLFGFRKHEQGQNAKEIPEFDPLIEKADAEIDRIKRGGAKSASSGAEQSGVERPGSKADAPASTDSVAKTETKRSDGATSAGAVAPDPSTALRSAQDDQKVAPLPPPTFDIDPNLEVTLWAENPLLEKPTQVNWDANGRLWVASSGLYPMIAPGEDTTDKIIVLEDTNHDGTADKSTVFAEGLLLPTGVEPDGTDAAYVGQSTELLHFADTDGDGKADEKRIVLSGFGTEDTHHIIHTLRWGPDGRLYFNQSIYIHSHLETPWGMVRLNSGGVFAYDPRTERVEVLFKGFCNPWGHAWDKWGQSFLTDGAGFQGVSWGIPGAMYFTYENARAICPSISPGNYPKFAGLELVQSPQFPDDWQGNAITCDFRAHRVVRFQINDLSESGESKPETGKEDTASVALSGYVTKEMPDLMRTGDVSFRPIDVKLGPDGALYIADWSNPVINHGEVDFRDPRRDHTHGRIWRVSYKGRDKVKLSVGEKTAKSELDVESLGDLIEALTKPDGSSVTAKQVPAMLRRVPSFVREENARRGADSERSRAEMRRIEELRKTDPDGADRASSRLSDDLVKSHSGPLLPLDEIGAKIPELASKSANPRIRLEAMRVLARLQTPEAAALVLEAAMNQPGATQGDAVNVSAEVKGGQFDQKTLEASKDPYYTYAAWLSINDLAEVWTEAIAKGDWKADSPEKEKQLAWGLGAIRPELMTVTLSKLMANSQVPLDGSGPWIELIGQSGGSTELAKLYGQVFRANVAPDVQARTLRALVQAARLRNARPAGDLKDVATLFKSPEAEVAANALRLAGLWKMQDLAPLLTQYSRAEPEAVRTAAIEGLRDLGGADAITALIDLTSDTQPQPVRRQAAAALAVLDLQNSLPRVADVLTDEKTEAAALEAWRAVLSANGAPDTLASALPRTLTKPVAAGGLRAAREIGKKGEKLVAVLTPLAGLPAEGAKPQDYQSIAALVKRDGDPARGEQIYRRASLACTTCHAIGGAGGKVG
ncbi:MAG: PVC-type heme-binding CxxCH protein, partial [Chthoniobacteraceae bacterium]